MDLFDKPTTLETYLRGIVAGTLSMHHRHSGARIRSGPSSASSVRSTPPPGASGRGVGLGEEILLSGNVAGIGLTYEDRLVHLAAFRAPT